MQSPESERGSVHCQMTSCSCALTASLTTVQLAGPWLEGACLSSGAASWAAASWMLTAPGRPLASAESAGCGGLVSCL